MRETHLEEIEAAQISSGLEAGKSRMELHAGGLTTAIEPKVLK